MLWQQQLKSLRFKVSQLPGRFTKILEVAYPQLDQIADCYNSVAGRDDVLRCFESFTHALPAISHRMGYFADSPGDLAGFSVVRTSRAAIHRPECAYLLGPACQRWSASIGNV